MEKQETRRDNKLRRKESGEKRRLEKGDSVIERNKD